MQNDELKRQTKLTELAKISADIKESLAREHNWAQQEQHYTAQQRHYDAQQRQWKWVVILGFIAILINGLKSLWSN